MDANRSYRQIVQEILREADERDRREDELYGDARGDELPEQLRTPEGRRAALREARRRLAERKGRGASGAEHHDNDGVQAPEVELDPERFVTRSGGRRNWFREARRELEAHRERERQPIPRDRDERLFEAGRRLEENQQAVRAANQAYQTYRRSGRDTAGRRLGGPLKPYDPPVLLEGTINTSDPDSRVMPTQGTPPVQATTRRPQSTPTRSSSRPRSRSTRPTSLTWGRCSTRPSTNCTGSGLTSCPGRSSRTAGTGTRPKCRRRRAWDRGADPARRHAPRR